LTRRFERLHENRVNTRKNKQTCIQCCKPRHFVANCLEKVEKKDDYKHRSRTDNKYRLGRDHKHMHKHKDERQSMKKDGRGRKARVMV
jgi:hypothetical protein